MRGLSRTIRRGAPGLAALLWAAAVPAAEPLRLNQPLATESDLVVSERQWAEELVERLGLEHALPEEPAGPDLFGLLCPERAERARAAGAGAADPGRFRVALPAPPRRGDLDPVRVVVTVPATSLYQLRVEGLGPQRWVIDGRPVGHLDASPLGVAQARGRVPLRAGPHEIAGYLGRGARVDRIELAADRTLCIAPADGWRGERPLSYGAQARTLLRAFDLERRLREEEEGPLPLQGESFEEASPGGARTNRRLAEPAANGAWATAVRGPAEFTWRLRLDEPGVLTLEARTHGGRPQIWSVDGRAHWVVDPESKPGGFAWNTVATLPLRAGQHAIRALLPQGAGVDVLRFVRHRSRDEDYVAVLRSLGLRTGAPWAPVSRGAAEGMLGSPTFAELCRAFRYHMHGGRRERARVLAEDPLVSPHARSLSPLLPADL